MDEKQKLIEKWKDAFSTLHIQSPNILNKMDGQAIMTLSAREWVLTDAGKDFVREFSSELTQDLAKVHQIVLKKIGMDNILKFDRHQPWEWLAVLIEWTCPL